MEPARPPRGRPRSTEARIAILTATRDLLGECGYDGITIVAIAARAGTGKQTVYRWWPSKAALVADCVLEGMVDLPVETARSSGDPIRDVRAWLEASHRTLAAPGMAPLLRALTAAAASDGGAAQRMARTFQTPLEDSLAEVLRAGIRDGKIRPDIDTPAIVAILLGTMTYAIVSRTGDGDPSAAAVAEIIMHGLAPRANEPGTTQN